MLVKSSYEIPRVSSVIKLFARCVSLENLLDIFLFSGNIKWHFIIIVHPGLELFCWHFNEKQVIDTSQEVYKIIFGLMIRTFFKKLTCWLVLLTTYQ